MPSIDVSGTGGKMSVFYNGTTLVGVILGVLSVAVGTSAFFRMEAGLAQHNVYVRLMKGPKDLQRVWKHYRELAARYGYPEWPARFFVICLLGLAFSAALLIVGVAPKWVH